MRARAPMILAEVSGTASDKSVELVAAVSIKAAESGANASPRFEIVAYTGGIMTASPFGRLAIELSGLTHGATLPALLGHKVDQVVGQIDSVEQRDGKLYVGGSIHAEGTHAKEVLALSRAGHNWQASVGVQASRIKPIQAGASAIVNGHRLTGPFVHVIAGTLREVSFVGAGADPDTSARIAAERSRPTRSKTMEFESWIRLQGWNPDEISDHQRTILKAAYDRRGEIAGGGGSGGGGSTGPDRSGNAIDPEELATILGEAHPDLRLRAIDEGLSRDQVVAEQHRREARRDIVAEILAGHEELMHQAEIEGWAMDPTTARRKLLQAQRGTSGPSRSRGSAASGDQLPDAEVLTAALCVGWGEMDDAILQAEFDEKVLDRADRYRNIGLRELATVCAQIDGHNVPAFSADPDEVIRAAVSTNTLASVADNTMGKMALATYDVSAITAMQIARIRAVNNFKEVASYRLEAGGKMEPVSKTGELQHGQLSDQKFTDRADTFGQLIRIDRQTMINDDVGILADIAREMGAHAFETIESVGWETFMAAFGTLFTTGNGNRVTGGDSAFGHAGLSKARTAFRTRKVGPGSKAKNQRRLGLQPAMIVVPPELETQAEELLVSREKVVATGSDATIREGARNAFQGKYRVIVAEALSDSTFTNASASQYLLMANPNRASALGLALYRGRRTPTFRRAMRSPGYLGMEFEMFMDFGFTAQDPNAAVLSLGQ